MNYPFLRVLICLLIFIHPSFAQPVSSFNNKKQDSESFEKLPDDIIKKEVGYINISGGHWEERDSLSKIKLTVIPVQSFTDTSAIFSRGNISIVVTASRFDSANHSYEYATDHPLVVMIDDDFFWGTDGGIPQEEIYRILYQTNKKIVKLPHTATKNLFEPNFCFKQNPQPECHCTVFQSHDKRRVYIHMLNGDGAGGYEVTWVIEDDKYLKRIVDFGF